MVQVWPDGDYSHGATWANSSDRVAWERSFQVGTAQTKRMAQAMLAASPDTTADEIRANMTAPAIMQSGMKTSPTLDDVLNTGPSGWNPGHLYDRKPTDFSGTQADIEAGPANSLNAY